MSQHQSRPQHLPGRSPQEDGDIRRRSFDLIVITSPVFFDGEVDCLEGLLAAGLIKLHIRKPGAAAAAMENLLNRLSDKWRAQLVLHGEPDMADRFDIPQVHCFAQEWALRRRDHSPIGKVSTSFHSWKEVEGGGAGLEYAFLSPLFDSISKPGYGANPGLLERPPGSYACKVIGLGGINKDTILQVIDHGWDGVALLGWIWEEPDAAVERYALIQQLVHTYRSKQRE